MTTKPTTDELIEDLMASQLPVKSHITQAAYKLQELSEENKRLRVALKDLLNQSGNIRSGTLKALAVHNAFEALATEPKETV